MVSELGRRRKPLAVLLLFLASTAWGATFVVVKTAVAHTPVLDFLAWRFLLAGLLLVVMRPRAVLALGRQGWAQGLVLGAMLFAGEMLQTFGLRYTTAAISGFLTGLQVVFVPLLGWLLLSHRPRPRTWLAAAMATGGLAVLSLRGLSIGLGDVLTIAAAAMFALQIVVLGRWASVSDAYGIATVQVLTVGAMSVVAAAPDGVGLPSTPGMWGAVALTAVVATAFAFAVQSWAQSHVSATSAAMAFTTEPILAALFAWGAGERIGWAVVTGGALVVGAMVALGLGGARHDGVPAGGAVHEVVGLVPAGLGEVPVVVAEEVVPPPVVALGPPSQVGAAA